MVDPRGRERLAIAMPCGQQDDEHDPHFYEMKDPVPERDADLFWCSGLGRPEAEED